MPTNSRTRKCNVHVVIWRPCRKDDPSRRFTPKKLQQILKHVCEDFGKEETKAAVEEIMRAHGCWDECDCEEEKEECERQKRDLERLLQELQARIVGLLAIIAAALAALMAGDEAAAKDALQGAAQPPDWPWWARLFANHLIESDDPADVERARRTVDFWLPMFDYLGEMLGPDQAAAGRCLTDLDPHSPIPQQIVDRQNGNTQITPGDQALLKDMARFIRTLLRSPQE